MRSWGNLQISAEKQRMTIKSTKRTRHSITWLDNSGVDIDGYLVCLAIILYDPAVFYLPKGYKVKNGQMVSIQSIIETQELHFNVRCDSLNGQLGYTETRLQCIQGLKTTMAWRQPRKTK